MLRTLLLSFCLVALVFPASPQAAERSLVGDSLAAELPENTFFYARIPHLTGLVAVPKGEGNALQPVLSNAARQELADDIVTAAIRRFGELEPDIAPGIVEWLAAIRSPFEFAVVQTPGPVLVASMTIDGNSPEALDDWLAGMAPVLPGLALGAALDADGMAPLDGVQAPAFVQFTPRSGEVRLLVGQALDRAVADQVVAGLDGSGGVAAAVSRFDTSGQGVVAWLNIEASLPMAQLFIPMEQYELLKAIGIEQMRSVILGMGVANGRARAGVSIRLKEGAETLLPRIDHALEARAVGTPESVIQFAIPDLDFWTGIEGMFEARLEGDDWASWQQIKSFLIDTYGFDLGLMAEALGPDMSVIIDASGDYLAVRIRDEASYRDWLDLLAAGDSGTLNTLRAGRQTINQWIMRDPVISEAPKDPMQERFAAISRDMPTYIYWVEEDGYLYVADVPQVLMGRREVRQRVEIGDWLADQQGVDFSSTVLGGTSRSRHVPRRLYHLWLSAMQTLADLGRTEFDILDMPTARELRLPSDTALGFAVNMGAEEVSIEITSDDSPFDFLFAGTGNGLAAVAGIGIVAAIAVPAYQDYTTRAQVNEGLAMAFGYKAFVTDVYAAEGRFPTAEEIEQFGPMSGPQVSEVLVEPDTGVIEIVYGGYETGDDLYGEVLVLMPRVAPKSPEGLEWDCTGSIEPKHMPGICRN